VDVSSYSSGSIITIFLSHSDFPITTKHKASIYPVLPEGQVGVEGRETSVAPPSLLDLAVLVTTIVHGPVVIVALEGVEIVLISAPLFTIISSVVTTSVAEETCFHQTVETAAIAAQVVAVFAGEPAMVVCSEAYFTQFGAGTRSCRAVETGFDCAGVRAAVSVHDIAVIATQNPCFHSIRTTLSASIRQPHHARFTVEACIDGRAVVCAAVRIIAVSIVAFKAAHPGAVVSVFSAVRVGHRCSACPPSFRIASSVTAISANSITIITGFT